MSISLKHADTSAAHSSIRVDAEDRGQAIFCPDCGDWFLRGPAPSIRTREQELSTLETLGEQLQASGLATALTYGCAGVSWLEIQLADGRIATLGMCNDTWTGEKYASRDELSAGKEQELYDLGLPTWVTDSAQVADLFIGMMGHNRAAAI
jgi:hypothetical protein